MPSRAIHPGAAASRHPLIAFAIMLAMPAWLAMPVHAGVLSGREFQNLLAGGPEGTTIVFQGGTDKIFYSPSLKNKLRLSAELGPGFLKQKILQNTVTEGVFIGATIEGGKWRTFSGIAGIAADNESGHGILTLLQTFPEDTSIKAFQKRDRLYSVVIVEDTPGGVVCRRSQWEKLFALKGEPKLRTVPCEFTVGNTVAPAGSQ
ncbi:MAG: hypothetical protein PS018_13125 [bacterium]|nr:hypothetical protein [bacterium]